MESVRDIFSDVFPAGSVPHEPSEELVIWAKFESQANNSPSSQTISFVLLLSTNRGFYIWAISVGYFTFQW